MRTDRDEQQLVRRVATGLTAAALLTVPVMHYGFGATESWVTVAHLVVFGGAFAALGRTRLRTRHVVLGSALLLWAATTASVSLTAIAVTTGTGEGAGLGSGLLWLAAGVGPALFIVLEVRRALLASSLALLGTMTVLAVATGGQLPRLVAHDGVWQVLVAIVVVIGAAAAVAWLAGRSADERRLALLLRQERAARTARLEASQRRRATVFSRTASELRTPMGELSGVSSVLRTEDQSSAALRDALARVEVIAGDLLRRVVDHIDGIVARISQEVAPTGVAPPDEPLPQEEPADATTTMVIPLAVFALVALDAWRTVTLAAGGVPDAHAAAAGANRMVVVLFLAAAVLAVRFPGRFAWWLSGLALLTHPIAVFGMVETGARSALLSPYVAAWRIAVLSTGMLAVLAVIIERRVQDRDALVAAASDEEARSAELARREEAAELAYAEAAHELKNPLSVIQGSARTLSARGDGLSPQHAETLRTALVRAIARLDARLAVMGDVAEAPSRATAPESVCDDDQRAPGTDTGRRRPVVAADVLLDALSAARMTLGDQPVDVDVRVTGVWTSAQPDAVEHVIENLLSNAHKYGDPDGMVRLTAHRDDEELVVEVANRGSDLARSDAQRIFEPYWRAANADERADGTGLGLAVVARLVEEWGGRCWARTTGGWTRVGFTMPVAESVQAPTWQQLQDQLG